jgi:ubiquinol-cytochrome c reductase cytochrome b subunit
MIRAFYDWMDHRTGWRKLLHEVLFERVPGGARWRYIWGSTLSFTFMIQVITGIILWAAYSPGSQSAWASVYYIQHEMWGGWLVRGIHHYTAQAMNILLVLHLAQVMIDGAYRAPREVNFWFGILMLVLVLALSLTGYLLPWDQKGYWASRVATNIVGVTPIVGPQLQQILIGGSDYGNHTLTRFFALHAGVLPGLLILLTVVHIFLFRRHGIKAKEPYRRPDAYFWPDQLLKDAVACLAVMGAVLALVFTLGTPLDAPADPSEPYSAARPEWYFLFLFEFLKYFPGEWEIFGAIIIPSAALGIIFLMPLIARWRAGHAFNLAFLCFLVAGAALLTVLALRQDKNDPEHQLAVAQARRDARRAIELAQSPQGIPGDGATALMRADAYTRGPRLFAQHCASCHLFDGHDGLGHVPKDPPSAPDLKNFASREWIAGLLDPERVDSLEYFGGTRFKEGRMVRYVKRTVARYNDEEKQQLQRVIKALSAEAALPYQRELDAADEAEIIAGRAAIDTEAMRCTECHEYRKPNPDFNGPRLTAYGSREWLRDFIANAAEDHFYGTRNDRMPLYGPQEILTEQEILLLTDWLRRDWYTPAAR